MNRLLMLLCFLFIGSHFTSAQGIEFFEGSYEEALEVAKEQNKLVFMDCYTVWCGPCKMMDKNTFTDEKVGDFFNQHFINVKMDMEKGEGPQLARSFRIRGYPTFLFIDPNTGEAKETAMGYRRAGDFLSIAQNLIEP
jgi:thiol:disulfide interchange protein